MEALSVALAEADIAAELSGRPKHISSIHRKMQRKGAELGEIYDVHALRVLVDDVRDCYARAGRRARAVAAHPRAVRRLHRDAQEQHVPEPPHRGRGARRQAARGPDPDARDAPRQRGGHRGALALQGGLAGRPRLRRQARLGAPAHGVAARRLRRHRVHRGRQARHLPGPGLRLHARAATSRTCPRARRRSTSRIASTPTSGTPASAPRSTTGSCRSTTS